MSRQTVLLAADGSDLALEAVTAGIALLQPSARLIVVTVVEPVDVTLVTGTGMASGVMSAREFDTLDGQLEAGGRTVVEQAAAALGVEGVEMLVRRGQPGPALCDLAEELSADAIVMGSRGRGGLRRALLGSVSDYIVRNAPCTVIIARPPTGDGDA
jgi:nucleotide-binding universal stress UspA family protein